MCAGAASTSSAQRHCEALRLKAVEGDPVVTGSPSTAFRRQGTGGVCCLNDRLGILHHEGVLGRHAQTFRSRRKDVGGWLGMPDILGKHQGVKPIGGLPKGREWGHCLGIRRATGASGMGFDSSVDINPCHGRLWHGFCNPGYEKPVPRRSLAWSAARFGRRDKTTWYLVPLPPPAPESR